MSPIEDRLQATLRIDAVNGDSFERMVVAKQIKEAIDEIKRLRAKPQPTQEAALVEGGLTDAEITLSLGKIITSDNEKLSSEDLFFLHKLGEQARLANAPMRRRTPAEGAWRETNNRTGGGLNASPSALHPVATKRRWTMTLTQLRQSKDLGLRELALAAGIWPSHLSDIEWGRKSASADAIKKLSNALNVSFDECSIACFHTNAVKNAEHQGPSVTISCGPDGCKVTRTP